MAQAENGDPKKEIILNYEKVMIGETVCQYFNLVNLTEVIFFFIKSIHPGLILNKQSKLKQLSY